MSLTHHSSSSNELDFKSIYKTHDAILFAERHSRRTIYLYLKNNLKKLKDVGVPIVIYLELSTKYNRALQYYNKTGDDSRIRKQLQETDAFSPYHGSVQDTLDLIKNAYANNIEVRCIDNRTLFFSNTSLGRLTGNCLYPTHNRKEVGDDCMITNFLALRKSGEKSMFIVGAAHADMFSRYKLKHLKDKEFNVFTVQMENLTFKKPYLLPEFKFDHIFTFNSRYHQDYRTKDRNQLCMQDFFKVVTGGVLLILIVYYILNKLTQENQFIPTPTANRLLRPY